MRTVDIVVNVRLASSRCPNKIIRPFASSSLLEIVIDKLLMINNASNKYIAAGDSEIIEKFKLMNPPGIKLLFREPDAVSQGEHDHRVSFRHYADVESDFIMIMNPCLPFSKPSTYDNAIRYFSDHEHIQSLTSVITMKDIFMDENFNVITLPNKDHISTTTAKVLYKMAHIFHIINKKYFIANGKFWDYTQFNPSVYQVKSEECFDVDTEEDFKFCENLYRNIGV